MVDSPANLLHVEGHAFTALVFTSIPTFTKSYQYQTDAVGSPTFLRLDRQVSALQSCTSKLERSFYQPGVN